MRRTQIRHSYDKLHSGNQPYPLHAVTIDGHTHLGSVTAQMAPGVTVFCGVSGVGKTQFLKILAAHLLGHSTGDVSVQASGIDLNGASTTGKRGEIIEHNHTTVRCFHVDTGRECFDTINQAIRTQGLDEKREAADKAPLSGDWTNRLGYILNRDYDEVSFQGLDREAPDTAGPSTWHYYELTYRGITYGPHQMSLGELAASIVLRVLRSTRYGDILLLDEPENFLSPQARQRLLDVIVQQAVDKKLSVVIASHSIEIIRRLPLASLRTIEQGPQGGATVANATIPSQATRAIGLELRPNVLLLVEDNFAHRLLKAILARLLPTLHLDLGIVESGRMHGSTGGGEGAVVTTARALWNNDIGIRVLGVLDGDYRKQHKRKPDYVAFLPGTTCPEDVVVAMLKSFLSDSASTLGVPEETLAKALQTAEGADIHDRPRIISNAIGIDVSELISCAARWLTKSSQYEQELQALIGQIRALLLQDHIDPDNSTPQDDGQR
ncbi:AAA family ATPase [Kibdelosporangium persicum]|uniref:AAA domain-containing protein, putative AbiEii toxin, Type IV TA system n=1 Tax=Kibdelosporangium persicum TaxID=2698649 RepID=A0ABX2FI22_9PSEU|nr:AAA family ATPase [Kibdelosporangium persicum]NRN71064.1 AAA domain-containing protein, putative AbiEii toxin, Type IV TA system [Kibdelosporangium persicum]